MSLSVWPFAHTSFTRVLLSTSHLPINVLSSGTFWCTVKKRSAKSFQSQGRTVVCRYVISRNITDRRKTQPQWGIQSCPLFKSDQHREKPERSQDKNKRPSTGVSTFFFHKQYLVCQVVNNNQLFRGQDPWHSLLVEKRDQPKGKWLRKQYKGRRHGLFYSYHAF